jgi:hypothetical protein
MNALQERRMMKMKMLEREQRIRDLEQKLQSREAQLGKTEAGYDYCE